MRAQLRQRRGTYILLLCESTHCRMVFRTQPHKLTYTYAQPSYYCVTDPSIVKATAYPRIDRRWRRLANDCQVSVRPRRIFASAISTVYGRPSLSPAFRGHRRCATALDRTRAPDMQTVKRCTRRRPHEQSPPTVACVISGTPYISLDSRGCV